LPSWVLGLGLVPFIEGRLSPRASYAIRLGFGGKTGWLKKWPAEGVNSGGRCGASGASVMAKAYSLASVKIRLHVWENFGTGWGSTRYWR
jgi:hypothetical protein